MRRFRQSFGHLPWLVSFFAFDFQSFVVALNLRFVWCSGMIVHQLCYGVPLAVGTLSWRCEACVSNVVGKVTCDICTSDRFGAWKKVKSKTGTSLVCNVKNKAE